MICGFLATGLIFTTFVYVTNERATAAHFKQQHPIISLILIFGSLYFIAYMFQSVLVFFLGILLPFSGNKICFTIVIKKFKNVFSISVIFLHASLRLRNIKNKIINRVEVLGLKRTPMGLFLEEMGLESELF